MIISFFIQSFSEIKRERLRVWERVREKNLEGGPDCWRKQQAPLTGAEVEAQSDEPIIDLPSTMSICESMLIRDEGRPSERVSDDDNDELAAATTTAM